MLFLIAWLVRAAAAVGIDRNLGLVKSGLATAAPIWLFPLCDLMSMTIMLASYASDQVEWRGQMMSAGRIGRDDTHDETSTQATSPHQASAT
jgi:hypothetical protein